jgi:HPt (histidine-containing phosphotransfer) domain-containing protein
VNLYPLFDVGADGGRLRTGTLVQLCDSAADDGAPATPRPMAARGDDCARHGALEAAALPVVEPPAAAQGEASLEPVAASPEDSAAASAPQAVVDAAVLERIRAMELNGASGLLPRLIEMYERSSMDLVRAGEDALAQADRGGLLRCLQTLRASSAGLGASRLAHSCAELAALAGEPSLAQVRSVWPELRAERERTVASLRSCAAGRDAMQEDAAR